MPLDSGLLIANALANFVGGGVNTYRDISRYNDERADKLKQQKMQQANMGLLAREHGYDYDPQNAGTTTGGLLDTQPLQEAKSDADSTISGLGKTPELGDKESGLLFGSSLDYKKPQMPSVSLPVRSYDSFGFSKTPQQEASDSLSLAKSKRESEELDPNSALSQANLSLTQRIANKASPGILPEVPKGMSASDLQNNKPLMEAIKGGFGMQGREATAANATDRMDTRMKQQAELAAQRQANSTQKDFVPRLEGAARINDIWKAVDSGKIKNNEAVKSLLVAEIQRLETGASNPAFGAQQQKEMATTAQGVGELVQRITGKPQDSVPPEIAKQIRELGSSLGHAYMEQADSAFDVLKSGANENQVPVFEQKHKALQDTYRKRLGYWGNEDVISAPKKGLISSPQNSAPSSHPADDAMLNWAKANPNAQGAAKVLKANGVQ